MSSIRAKFEELGFVWPNLSPPDLPFSPVVCDNGLLIVSGQIPEDNDEIVATGKVGEAYSLEEAKEIAAQCTSNVVFWIDRELAGDIDRVTRISKLTVFVNAVAGFAQYSEVANGASERINAVFGARGNHARSAIGVAGLPANVPVEVEAIVQVKP